MSNRGLHNFLTEIYSGATKQDIDIRINVELAKIKKAFFAPKLSPYNRKKYITKLCFIVLSGVPVCFGLPQIIDLIESKKVNAQRIGWMAAVIICGNDSNQVNELMPLFKRHLADSKNENSINFTLSAISSIGSHELAEAFGPTIAEIALSTNFQDYTRKKALLTLVSFYRCSQLQLIDTIAGRLTPLLSDSSYGMRLSVCHLIHTIQIFQPSSIYGALPQILEILNSFFIKNEYDHDYSFSDIPCPILSAQMIRILAFNTNWNDSEVKLIENILTNILNRSSIKRNEDGLFSYFTVFEEIVYLALAVPIANTFIDRIYQIMVEHINSSSLPIRYFCLNNLSTFIQFFPHLGLTHQFSLQPLYEMMASQDLEFNVPAIQLLYIIANKENGLDILTEFLNYIPKAPIEIKDLLFQKSSLLTLSFSIDEKWCIDTLIMLVCNCSSKLETNLLQSITLYIAEDKDKQIYLIKKIYSMITNASLEFNLTSQFIKLSAYIFGEYAALIRNEIELKNIIQKLKLFYQNIKSTDLCKSMIVTCFFKLCIKHVNFKKELSEFISSQRQSLIADVSQRCCEYTKLLTLFPNSFLVKIATTSLQNRRMPSVSDISLPKFKKSDKKSSIYINNKPKYYDFNNNVKTTTIIPNNNFFTNDSKNSSALKNEIVSNNMINDSNINSSKILDKSRSGENVLNVKLNANNPIIKNDTKIDEFCKNDFISLDEESALTEDSVNLSMSSLFLNSNEGQIYSNSVCNVSVSFVIFPPNAKVSVFISNIIPASSTNQASSKNLIFSKKDLKSNQNSDTSSTDEEEEEYEEEEEEEEEYDTVNNKMVNKTEKDNIKINNFAISTVNDLKFRIIDFSENKSCEIEPGKQKEIVIEFVAVGIFDHMPDLTFEVNRETVKTKIPIIFPRWIKEMPMDKATFLSRWNQIGDPSHTASVTLVIPDGDVMSSVISSAKRTFGIEPLNIELPDNIIVMCGVFRCLSKSIGFLLRFVFNEEENDLSLTIKTTSPPAIDILKKRAYNAFVL